MHLLSLLILKILDAFRRIEAWVESSILDNENSSLITTLGLGLALLFGLWQRHTIPLFRIEADGSETERENPVGSRRPFLNPRESAEYRFDLQGRMVDIPCGADELIGSDRETMIGSLFSRYLLESDVAPVIEGFIRVLRGESVVGLRVRLRRVNGDLVPAEMDLSPVLRSGEIEGVRGVLRALPVRIPAVRRGSASPGKSVYILRKGKMLFINARFEEISGYGREDLSSVDPMQIIHPADQFRVRRSNIGHLKGDPPSSCDFRIVTRDGRVRWVRARIRPVTYKGQKAILGYFVVMPAKEEPLQGGRGRGRNGAASARYGCSASA